MNKLKLLLAIVFLTLQANTTWAQWWEGEVFCPSKSYCSVIQDYRIESDGDITCSDGILGHTYDCSDYFKTAGANILNTGVRVTAQGVDACHIPGGCGIHGCTYFGAVARPDAGCAR